MRRLGSLVVVAVLFVGIGVVADASEAVAVGVSLVCDADSAGSVVVYDPAGGDVFVVDVNAAGDGLTFPSASGTVSGADTVGTAYLGGPEPTVDDVVFYSSVTGRFQFASITAPDQTTGHRDLDVFADVTGTRGWTHVITGDYNGDGTGDVLFYRASDGLMRFYTTSASGAFIPLTPAYFGTRGWTHLVAGDYNGDGSDDVLWYRARDGLMRFYEVTDSGEFRALTPAYFGTRNWTTIPAGDYNGDGTDDVMFYRGDGVARFYEVDATGTFRALGVAFHPSSGYTQIESVEFTPDTPGVDLVWYRAGSDLLVATRYNVNGVISLWNPQSTSVYGDDLIIATATTCGSAPPTPPGGSAQPSPPIRAAFMYPWFSEAWDQGGRDPFTQFTPSLGRYDSSDPGIIDQQVGLATGVGIDAFVNSWWGPGHHTDSATMDVLNRIPRSPNPDFRIAVYYEEEGHADPSAAAIKGDLEYLERFFSHPAYLRVQGKPVVFVWATGGDGAGMAARWSDAKRLYGGNVHIVLKVFSGYRDVPDQPDSWHQYGPSTAYSEHLPHSAVVSPGFWHAKETSPRLGRDPVRFRNDVAAMKASGAFWQLVTTWNEWGEGTSVEPAAEFGSTYLDILADAFARSRTSRSP